MLALAQTAGYGPCGDWLEMAGDGLPAFVRRRCITCVVFLNCPSSPSLKVSSNGITKELSESVRVGRPSAFEHF